MEEPRRGGVDEGGSAGARRGVDAVIGWPGGQEEPKRRSRAVRNKSVSSWISSSVRKERGEAVATSAKAIMTIWRS